MTRLAACDCEHVVDENISRKTLLDEKKCVVLKKVFRLWCDFSLCLSVWMQHSIESCGWI